MAQPDFNIVVQLERFPYTVELNGRVVATIYVASLAPFFAEAVAANRGANRLKAKINDLIRIIRAAQIPLTPDQEEVMDLEVLNSTVKVKSDPNALMKEYGIKLGQVWQSNRSKKNRDQYTVLDIDETSGQAVLVWIGPFHYRRPVPFDKLIAQYTLVSSPEIEGVLNEQAVDQEEDDLYDEISQSLGGDDND